jgi:uncharacterized protein
MFKWQRICITGASSGLGWALSLGLARPGITLILSGRNEARLAQLARLVQDKGAYALTCASDLATSEGQQRLISLIDQEAPDLLINSAGIGAYGNFIDTKVERALDIVRLNVMGTAAITHAWCRTLLRRSTQGKVVFVSSAAALLPFPGMSMYAASKACLNSFAEGLRYELKDQGIEVLTVCPGHFGTNFQRRAAGKEDAEPSSAEANEIANDIIGVLGKQGVYMPRHWRWLLRFKWLVPRAWLMGSLQRRVLSYLQPPFSKSPSP